MLSAFESTPTPFYTEEAKQLYYPPSSLRGSSLFVEYEVLDSHTMSGSYGCVYKVQRKYLSQPYSETSTPTYSNQHDTNLYALKCPQHMTGEPEKINALRWEIYLFGKIGNFESAAEKTSTKHNPFIVCPLDYVMLQHKCEDGRMIAIPHIVEHWAKGGSLRNQLNTLSLYHYNGRFLRPLSFLHRVLDIYFQLTIGLLLIHNQGIAHADIKPENILLDAGISTKAGYYVMESASLSPVFMNVQLCDFGLSCVDKFSTLSTELSREMSSSDLSSVATSHNSGLGFTLRRTVPLGTQCYRPPEQADMREPLESSQTDDISVSEDTQSIFASQKKWDVYSLGMVITELLAGYCFLTDTDNDPADAPTSFTPHPKSRAWWTHTRTVYDWIIREYDAVGMPGGVGTALVELLQGSVALRNERRYSLDAVYTKLSDIYEQGKAYAPFFGRHVDDAWMKLSLRKVTMSIIKEDNLSTTTTTNAHQETGEEIHVDLHTHDSNEVNAENTMIQTLQSHGSITAAFEAIRLAGNKQEEESPTESTIAYWASRDRGLLMSHCVGVCGLSSHQEINDTQLLHFALSNPDLHFLDLEDASFVTGVGIAALAMHCPKLRTVLLTDCIGITDKGLEGLANACPNLRELNLDRCLVSNHGIRSIVHSCPRLMSLSVTDCLLITDDGIVALAEHCRHIEKLFLPPNITSLSLQHLAKCSSTLRIVELLDCDRNITPIEIVEFIHSSPKLENIFLSDSLSSAVAAILPPNHRLASSL